MDPGKIIDLSMFLGELGVDAEVRVDTEADYIDPVLQIHDGHFNARIISEREDPEGYTAQVLDHDKFLDFTARRALEESSMSELRHRQHAPLGVSPGICTTKIRVEKT